MQAHSSPSEPPGKPFCTLAMNSLSKIKKTVPFTTASKRIKYLGISLNKEVGNAYTENHGTWLGIKEDVNKWKDAFTDWESWC